MKTKRIAYALLLSSLLVGCAPSDAELQEQGWVKDPANNGWVQNPETNGWVKDPATNGWVKDPANNGWVTEDKLTPSPTVTADVVHWVPGADTANVTFNLDLEGAKKLNVVLGGKLLKEFVDYEFDAGKLTILGAFLEDSGLGLGEHNGYVFTENGSVEIKVHIVSNPAVEGTTIPLKEINDINLGAFASQTLSSPIPNTADLFISEISAEMGNYNYIEVFNNTSSEYNLKDHRIVLADPSKQDKGIFTTNGLVEEPLGMGCSAYIYQDYKIPALSSAVIWLVNTTPWTQSNGAIVENANIKQMILGNDPENLSVSKFKDVYGLDSNALVFPARTVNGLFNGTYGYQGDHYGTALYKSGSNAWSDINTKTDKRMIQIQKYDETVFEESGKYFYYDVDVVNREEDIYADGKFDATDIANLKGFNASAATSGTNRQAIHALSARKIYVTSATDKTPTGEIDNQIDLYNADKDPLLAMLGSGAVKPVSTAMVYPNIVDDTENPGTKIAAKWGDSYAQFGLQYAAPAQGSHMSRFIPLEGTTALYTAFYASHAYKSLYESGLGSEVVGYGANASVKVPVSDAYPTGYLAANHNSIGRTTAIMLPAATA